MSIVSILEVFGAVVTALGGWEFFKMLLHRKQERRLKESEADQSKVATENAMRDMYEETLARMRELDEKRIAEIRGDYQARIDELNKANAQLHDANMGLHKQNLELLKEGARKDDIILDKNGKIRELNELLIEETRKSGKLEKEKQFFKSWKCFREFGKEGDKCDRRKPKQNPPLQFKPLEEQ